MHNLPLPFLVGFSDYYDADKTLGMFGYGNRNDRGTWLVRRCSNNDLAVANTHFNYANADTDHWTYSRSDLKLRLDYFLIPNNLLSQVSSCHVLEDVDIGSHHRPLNLNIRVDAAVAKSRRRNKTCWKDVDVPKYKSCLGSLLQSYPSQTPDTSAKGSFLENALRTAYSSASATKPRTVNNNHDVEIKRLIAQRRALGKDLQMPNAERRANRRQICKEIQARTRKNLKPRKPPELVQSSTIFEA